MSKSSIQEEYERCITCGKFTRIPVSTPVDWRENYEIELGQVFAECRKKQRETDERASTLYNGQFLLIVG